MEIRGMQGGFKESMDMAKTIKPTIEGIIGYLQEIDIVSGFIGINEITPADITIKKSVYDSRNGWNTFMVLLNGFPVAYTNGDVNA